MVSKTHESPIEEVTGGFTSKSQDEISKHIKKSRTVTLPVRGESSTDYTGPWSPQYILSLGTAVLHTLVHFSGANL